MLIKPSSTISHLGKQVLVEIVWDKAIEELPTIFLVKGTNHWRKPIMEYLSRVKLPHDDK